MRLLERTKGLSKEHLYALVMPEESTNMGDKIGTNVVVDQFCISEEADDYSGEIKKVLAIKSGDEIVITNSKSCIRDFEKMLAIFKDDVKCIYVYTEMSSNMRDITRCRMGGVKPVKKEATK